ncbi:hypothetical protein A3H78_01125 [Candidatus Roizmanbacteria bacterium RIFCSPLOWO2_02_FULL_36_11]|uniref:Polymerase nucleotidyl transferase domain-containing protein n=1 Tax=Candidatus Roizmanbacteria bacterium RIFCSPLOWO2_02_FULL_36_11 TaxID=1802071 RepID=A0A1F7JIK3_9BACT|nr:MAG: hypothetical protein A3H78_01125 [Candidatus Roizmanbacteria bacterium RIFCSPLOWO2_02_FULL_36_11]
MIKTDLKLEGAIKDVVNYFNYFSYPPDIEEIHHFLQIKVEKSELQNILNNLVTSKKLKIINTKYFILHTKNAIPSHRIYKTIKTDRAAYSQIKLKKINLLIKLLSPFPQIHLVGLSGSLTMNFADRNDDIDLFIISCKKRIWTARWICIIITTLLGLRRKRNQTKANNKVCLNMFFDSSALLISTSKQNLYTAHEVVQMKPIINKFDTYNKFININSWVFDFFPNILSSRGSASLQRQSDFETHVIASPAQRGVAISPNGSLIGNFFESIFKHLQLVLINRHRTTEFITEAQLWFHPEDFEKKLRKDGIIS